MNQYPIQKAWSVAVKLIAVLLVSQFVTFAQPLEPRFAKHAGGPGVDIGEGIAVSQSGSVFVAGGFAGTAQFEDIALSAVGSDDIFLAKYDPQGTLLWVRQAGGNISSNLTFERANAVAVDSGGNAVITGLFGGSARFGRTTFTGAGQFDLFLAKYDPQGELLWALRAGSPGIEAGFDVTVDSQDNVIVTGTFEGRVSFDDVTLTSKAQRDLFVAKYDPQGELLWAKQAGGADDEVGFGVTTDDVDNVWITGRFESTIDVEGTTLTSSGQCDILVIKYAPDGTFQWAKQAGGRSNEAGNAIQTDHQGNAYVTGAFQGTVSFEGVKLINRSKTGQSMFLAKYEPQGVLQWAVAASSTAGVAGTDLVSDGLGNTFVTGTFRGTASFGDAAVTGIDGGRDIFVAHYDAQGTLQWVVAAGGPDFDGGTAIDSDGKGGLYLTGWLRGPATFGEVSLPHVGLDDIFVAKFGTQLVEKGQSPLSDRQISPAAYRLVLSVGDAW